MRAPPGAGLEPRARGLTSRTDQGPAGCREATTTGRTRAMVRALLDDPGTSTHAIHRSPQEELLMPPEQEPDLRFVAYQLSELKKARDEDRQHVDARLDKLHARLDQLTFVPKESYAADRAADARIAAADRKVIDDFAQETRKIAENARTVAWATATALLAAVVTLLAVIKAVAG